MLYYNGLMMSGSRENQVGNGLDDCDTIGIVVATGIAVGIAHGLSSPWPS